MKASALGVIVLLVAGVGLIAVEKEPVTTTHNSASLLSDKAQSNKPQRTELESFEMTGNTACNPRAQVCED